MAPSIPELLADHQREEECFCVDALPDVWEPVDSQVEEEGASRVHSSGDRVGAAVPVRGMRLALFSVVDCKALFGTPACWDQLTWKRREPLARLLPKSSS
jgi:hypothetical protein